MAHITQPRPTDSELEILRVLWAGGPCTVREVCEQLNQKRAMGYTTVLKLMQIMAEKRLVRRNQTQRAHIYETMLPPETTQGQLVRHLVVRPLSGSRARPVMQ